MDRREHLLTIFAEECSELHKEISKALRFGLHEQRDLPTSNFERIVHEWSDLVAIKEMVEQEAKVIITDDKDYKAAKKEKVERYLEYSKECGTLQQPTEDDNG